VTLMTVIAVLPQGRVGPDCPGSHADSGLISPPRLSSGAEAPVTVLCTYPSAGGHDAAVDR
jgi:hypothetical protein